MKHVLTLLFVLVIICGCNSASEKPAPDSSEGEKTSQLSEDGKGNNSNWAADTWNGAVSTGSQTVNNTTEWISSLYKTAKREGLTGANSAKEWVTSDLKSQGDFQYKIISFDPSNTEEIETQLNALGQQRWDCYHVKTADDKWTFFMKRAKRSYLKNIPLRDLANFLPAIGGNDQ